MSGGFAIVVAADEEGGIGREGGLPWRLRGDLLHFRELTTGGGAGGRPNAVLMGRRTWASIPARFRPLPGRLNLVLSRDPGLSLPEGVLRAGSFEGALELLGGREGPGRIFVVGGGQVYREALAHPGCSRVALTRVLGRFDCDTFFPDLCARWRRVSASEPREEGGIRYRFEEYVRRA